MCAHVAGTVTKVMCRHCNKVVPGWVECVWQDSMKRSKLKGWLEWNRWLAHVKAG